jgi:hypothetical protein
MYVQVTCIGFVNHYFKEMRYILAAPISNSNCNTNFCFLPLHIGNELTFWLNVTRYLVGGGGGEQGTQFSRKNPFFAKIGSYEGGLGLGVSSGPPPHLPL